MTTAAGVLVNTLHAWGIDTIFGIPGDGINGIMESLRKRAKNALAVASDTVREVV